MGLWDQVTKLNKKMNWSSLVETGGTLAGIVVGGALPLYVGPEAAVASASAIAAVGDLAGSLVKDYLQRETPVPEQFLEALQDKIKADGLPALGTEFYQALRDNLLDGSRLLDILVQDDWTKALEKILLPVLPKTVPAKKRRTALSKIIEQCQKTVAENFELQQKIVTARLCQTEMGLEIHTDNYQYAETFTQPLFLHRDRIDSKVTLQNLYVMPAYENAFVQINQEVKLSAEPEVQEVVKEAEASPDLEQGLQSFLNGKMPFLLIVGDAGVGKSTLVAWMNYHYGCQDKTGKDLFKGRPLITVRLRNLAGNDLVNGARFQQRLLEYLQLKNVEELNRRFANAVLLLDGFDELCMLREMTHHQQGFFKELYQMVKANGFQLILTTRPHYFNANGLQGEQYCRFTLKHFDLEKRELWVKQYKNECGESLSPQVEALICSEMENTKGVCDTPMMLYMLAASPEADTYLDNTWALYRYVFASALSRTEYNRVFTDDGRGFSHNSEPISRILYRVNEEIAFAMFRSGQSKFYLQEAALETILQEMKAEYPELAEEETHQIAAQCHALCCYWKEEAVLWNGQRRRERAAIDADLDEDLSPQETGSRGAIEFLHNNIRDFFLAEKLYRELNKTAVAMQKTGETSCQPLTDTLARLLWHAPLEPMVCYFVYHRALYEKARREEQTWVKWMDFAGYEASDHKIKDILDDFSDKGILRNAGMFLKEENPKEENGGLHGYMLNIVKNTMMLYRVAYEPYLKEGEYIRWCDWKRGKTDLVYALFAEIFRADPFCQYVPHEGKRDGVLKFSLGSRSDYTGKNKSEKVEGQSGADLCGIVLKDTSLCGSNLRFASMDRANLARGDLMGAHLTGATLTGADLSDACLSDADLSSAVIYCASLPGTDMWNVDLTSANLVHADLTEADLRGAKLIRTNLSSADLHDADLRGADLHDADLRGANLIGATLPDGSSIDKQDEQIRRLHGMKFGNLKLDSPLSETTRRIQKEYDDLLKEISESVVPLDMIYMLRHR